MTNMKKFFSQFRAPLIILSFIIGMFIIPHFAHAQLAGFIGGIASDAIDKVLQTVSTAVLGLASLLSYISGLALNQSIQFTIVDIAKNIGGTAPNTFGASISSIWGTIRDIANMSFIFVLLYTAVMTMFGKGDYKKTIVSIVVAAILVNFSLFFTKVIIDAGNLIALTFYHAIVPATSGTGTLPSGGISDAFTQQLHLSTLWKPDLSAGNIITIGLLGSVFLVIASFVFLAVALLFIVRYVILIIVIILSPLAFVADAVPGLKSYGKTWWNTLMGQTFFPAIYFLLTWIVLKLISTAGFIPGNLATALGGIPQQAGTVIADPNAITTIFDFILIIAFLIMTLVLSKGMADKSSNGLTKWVGGVAGGATVGLAGRFARGTVGRAGQAIADNEKLKAAAPTSRLARLALAAGGKTATSSFDIRATGVGKTLNAGAAQKGGFADDMKNRIKKEVDTAKTFKASEPEKKRVEDAEKAAKETLDKARETADKNRNLRFESLPDVQDARARVEKARQDMVDAPVRLGDDPKLLAQREANLEEAQRELEKLTKPHEAGRALNVDLATSKEATDLKTATRAKEAVTGRMEAYATTVGEQKTFGKKFKVMGRIFPWGEFNVAGVTVGGVKKEYTRAEGAIRKAAKEKSNKDKLADAAAALAKENADADDAAKKAAASATPPAGGTTPPSTGGGAPTP